MQLIVMMGTTCAGKTTHGKLLADAFKYQYVSSGDIARGLMDADTARNFTQGELSPYDDEIAEAIFEKLDAETIGMVLDGYPRTQKHYAELRDWVTRKTVIQERPLPPIVIYLAISPKIAIGRAIARQRDEFDTEEVVRKRHELFMQVTRPIVQDAAMYAGWCLIELDVHNERSIEGMQSVLREFLQRPRSSGCCISALV